MVVLLDFSDPIFLPAQQESILIRRGSIYKILPSKVMKHDTTGGSDFVKFMYVSIVEVLRSKE